MQLHWKTIKNQGIKLTEAVKVLHFENYKTLVKESNDTPCLRIRKSRQFTDLMQSVSIYQRYFSQKTKTNFPKIHMETKRKPKIF